ncbi:MAG: hypothetical protein ABI323_09055 [Solirubrobacteraceae bacterium]
MIDAMQECEISKPYPRAFDAASYVLGVEELAQLLTKAGFRDVTVETVELGCVWAAGDDAVATISGTPFGPTVSGLPVAKRERVQAVFRERLECSPAGEVRVRTASNIARGVK